MSSILSFFRNKLNKSDDTGFHLSFDMKITLRVKKLKKFNVYATSLWTSIQTYTAYVRY